MKLSTATTLQLMMGCTPEDVIIDEMAEAELLMKKDKVHHYLNAAFFNYYASKSNLQQKAIEAKLTKSYADDF